MSSTTTGHESPFGPTLAGAFISHVFFGGLCVQTYTYFFGSTTANDPWQLKLLVAGLWALEFVHSALMSHSVYDSVITRAGSTTWIPTATVEATLLVQAIVASVVQVFYAIRLRRLSGKFIWLLAIVVLVLTRIGFSAALTAGIVQHGFGTFYHEYRWVVIIPIALGIVQDVIIAVGMIYYLQRSKTAFKHTREMINYLIILAIEGSGLTTVVGLIFMGFIATHPTNMLWQTFYFMWGKIYSNSLLMTLNTRSAIRERTGKGTVTIPLGELNVSNSFSVSPLTPPGNETIEIEKGVHVTTEKFTH